MQTTAAALFLCLTLWSSTPAVAADSCADTRSLHQPGDPDDTSSIERAVATGRCVHLEADGRELIVSHDIVVKTPSQLIYGDGRLTTRLRSGDPHGFRRGMFVAASGEPGPIFRDFGVFYNQPDTLLPGRLFKYPPAFAMDATPRFRMEHMGCYLATVCVEARKNSGGAILQDVQLTAFSTGLDFDDAYDSVRLENVHWGPFYLTPQLRRLFLERAIGHTVGIHLGRVDDFHLVDGTFLGGLAAEIGPSRKDGSLGFGSIRGCDFDTYDGVHIEAVSTLEVVGNTFTLGVAGATSFSMANGLASVVGNTFLLSVPGRPIAVNGGMATIDANTFAVGRVDATLLSASGARIVFDGNVVAADPVARRAAPLVAVERGTLVATANMLTPRPAGAMGIFLWLGPETDDARFANNVAPGWLVKRTRLP